MSLFVCSGITDPKELTEEFRSLSAYKKKYKELLHEVSSLRGQMRDAMEHLDTMCANLDILCDSFNDEPNNSSTLYPSALTTTAALVDDDVDIETIKRLEKIIEDKRGRK